MMGRLTETFDDCGRLVVICLPSSFPSGGGVMGRLTETFDDCGRLVVICLPSSFPSGGWCDGEADRDV